MGAGTPGQYLASLSEVGVGAIYLGAASDRFDLVDNRGMLLGQTNAAGIMLMESGEVRTVQEIDLADQFEATPSTNPISLQLSESEQGRLAKFSESLARLQEVRSRQQTQMGSVGIRQAHVASPLEQLLKKLEELRQKLIEELNMDDKLKSKDLEEVVFKRDELTYQLVKSRL